MGDYYDEFLSSPSYRASRAQKALVIESVIGRELRSAGLIGDVGSGNGLLKRELERLTGRKVFGFEVDPAMPIERSRTCIADGGRLPVPDGTFDLLLLNHVYEHVADPRALFREMARILTPGGHAYVTAGNKWAIVEPHYRLPFLSWLPGQIADLYLRWTRRGESYRDIRFLGYRTVVRCMSVPGLRVNDVTERAIRSGLRRSARSGYRLPWRILRRLPGILRGWVLRRSPQWFFLLERVGASGDRTQQVPSRAPEVRREPRR